MSKKVVTLGEIMLRLSTPDFKRFVQADTFDITYGGGEANVAAALCNYGLNGTFVSKVPNNPIGQSAIQRSTFSSLSDRLSFRPLYACFEFFVVKSSVVGVLGGCIPSVKKIQIQNS